MQIGHERWWHNVANNEKSFSKELYMNVGQKIFSKE